MLGVWTHAFDTDILTRDGIATHTHQYRSTEVLHDALHKSVLSPITLTSFSSDCTPGPDRSADDTFRGHQATRTRDRAGQMPTLAASIEGLMRRTD
jgi:hypothetical protein